jgi:hypothetical protein
MYRTVVVPVGYGDVVDHAVARGASMARQGGAELALGSVSERVVRTCGRPVSLVRGGQRRFGDRDDLGPGGRRTPSAGRTPT